MRSASLVSALVILGVACFVDAQLDTAGTCPTFKVKKNFERSKYLGRWYEYSKYETKFEKGATCSSADYSDLTVAGGPVTIGVLNRRKDPTKGLLSAKGNATLGEPDNAEKPAKLVVNFYDPPSRVKSTTTNYNVIDTDYTSYTIVYFCRQKDASTKSEFLWILTRQRIPPQTLVNKAMQTITNEGIDTGRLMKNVQTDCPELPNSSPALPSMGSPIFVVAVVQVLALRFW